MKTTNMIGAPLLVAVLAVLAACSPRDEDAMGPAQKAGKAMDEAGDKVARELRAPLEKADEAAQRAVERAEDAGWKRPARRWARKSSAPARRCRKRRARFGRVGSRAHAVSPVGRTRPSRKSVCSNGPDAGARRRHISRAVPRGFENPPYGLRLHRFCRVGTCAHAVSPVGRTQPSRKSVCSTGPGASVRHRGISRAVPRGHRCPPYEP